MKPCPRIVGKRLVFGRAIFLPGQVFDGDDVKRIECGDFTVLIENRQSARSHQHPFRMAHRVFVPVGSPHYEGPETTAGDSLANAIDVHAGSLMPHPPATTSIRRKQTRAPSWHQAPRFRSGTPSRRLDSASRQPERVGKSSQAGRPPPRLSMVRASGFALPISPPPSSFFPFPRTVSTVRRFELNLNL